MHSIRQTFFGRSTGGTGRGDYPLIASRRGVAHTGFSIWRPVDIVAEWRSWKAWPKAMFSSHFSLRFSVYGDCLPNTLVFSTSCRWLSDLCGSLFPLVSSSPSMIWSQIWRHSTSYLNSNGGSCLFGFFFCFSSSLYLPHSLCVKYGFVGTKPTITGRFTIRGIPSKCSVLDHSCTWCSFYFSVS